MVGKHLKPSMYLDRGLKNLRLDNVLPEGTVERIKRSADGYQNEYPHGAAHVTMAAALSLFIPFVAPTNLLINRSGKEIASAFDCSVERMRHRATAIRTAMLYSKSK